MSITQFNYLRSKREARSDGKYNIIHLYECGECPALDDLIKMAESIKRDIDHEYFVYLIFFTDRKYAVFAAFQNAIYNPDQMQTSFIKATYTYCKVNGYSKLVCYNDSSSDSRPVEIDI